MLTVCNFDAHLLKIMNPNVNKTHILHITLAHTLAFSMIQDFIVPLLQ